MWAKRLFDIVTSITVLVITLPLFLGISILIKFDSPGPIFFRQIRVGRNGALFRIYKFRSMEPDAEKIGGYSTAQGDPRITRSGHFLRRTSCDELPQLLNVLLGDMSLVGPRPDVPAQREDYTEEEWQARHIVRPGITGLAQATVRSQAKAGQRKALDLTYVEQASLWFDLKILVWTVKQILYKGGH